MSQKNLLQITIGSLLFFILVASGPLKPYRKTILNKESPQLILVLGGDVDREHIGVSLASKLNLPLIVSGGSNPEHAEWLIKKSALDSWQVKFDYRAKDTLGNFTSIVDELLSKNINHIIVITSTDHLPRALIVGKIIAGSRGINLTSIPVSCANRCKKESLEKIFIDLIRAVIWVTTGKDVKELTKQVIKWDFENKFSEIFHVKKSIPYLIEN